MKKRFSFRPLPTLWACLVYLFLYLPILVVVVFSFNSGDKNITLKGFTFAWYARMFENRPLMDAFWNTVIVAAVSTLLSVLLGTLCALGLYRCEFKLKSLISTGLYIPIVIPEIVFGIALLLLFSVTRVQTGLITLIISHITFSLPFVVITVRSRLSGFDRSLTEAAEDLGADAFSVFRRVTLPLIMPGIVSGGLLALTLSLDDVVVSTFTTGAGVETLPLKIQSMVKRGVSPDVNALSTVIVVGIILIVVISNLVSAHKKAQEKGAEEKNG